MAVLEAPVNGSVTTSGLSAAPVLRLTFATQRLSLSLSFLHSTGRQLLATRGMASAEGSLPAGERPHMYRIWYQILIQQVCRTAKASPQQRPVKHLLQKDGKSSALSLMDKCLNAWAANLSEAFSEKNHRKLDLRRV